MNAAALPEMRQARPQSAREEQANVLSHGLGFVVAAALWPLLSDLAAQRRGPTAALGISVFCLTAMLVFTASMVYHALPPGPAKEFARRCDHAAIFVFIAGSYTPFAIGPLRDTIGPTLLASIWLLALLGVVGKVFGRLSHRGLSTVLYAAMGWLAIMLLDPLAQRAGTTAVSLLLAGGAAYTVGAVFYLLDRHLRFGHFVWHLFVLAGSACHVFAALGSVA